MKEKAENINKRHIFNEGNMRFIFLVLYFLSLAEIGFAADFQASDLKETSVLLDKIEQTLQKGNATAQNLSENLKTVNKLQAEINEQKQQRAEQLENTQKKLDALGEPTDIESAEIKEKRKEFTAQAEVLKSQVAEIDLLNAKIEEISALTLKIRNKSLLDRLSERQISIFQFKAFGSALARFGSFIGGLFKAPPAWYEALDAPHRQSVKDNIYKALFIIFLIGAFSFGLSFAIRRRFGYRDCAIGSSYRQKLRSAAAMSFALGVVPAAVIGAFLFWLHTATIFENGNLGILLKLAALYFLIFCLIRATVRVCYVPRCGNWRIINVDDAKARAVSRAFILSSALILSMECLLHFARLTATEPESIYALQILGIAAKAFGLFITTRALLKQAPEEKETAEDSLALEAKINLLTTAFLGVVILLSLAGFVPLAEFLLNRVILSLLTIGAFWLLDKFLRFAVHRLLLFKFWRENLHIGARFLVKTEFWFGLLLTPFVCFAALIAILSLWGFSTDIMLHDVKNFLLGFDIGGMHVSIVSLLLGIAAFFVALFLSKRLKQSLLRGNLSKIEMQEDTRASLAAGISLIGFIVAVVVAFAVMGGSLKSIAIVAGALSFGVGLGMQNIVSNFVSGIIIIFERPIKIGDWVVINGQEGIVKTISMRATLLEAFNKSAIIIPNSAILSSSLTNLTYNSRTGQVEIKTNVKYGADAAAVRQTLLDIANETPGVLSAPAPSAAFENMAESVMQFSLKCYVANVFEKQAVTNNIYEKILEIFPQKGFEIPNVPMKK